MSEFSSGSEPSLDGVPPIWPLSRDLLMQIIEDRISDCFVAELVWERLGYQTSGEHGAAWLAGPATPQAWKQAFPEAPPVIAQRPASVQLTRSIAKPHKQLLKEQLKFAGYRISELKPRRTRRATAVNWLLAWLAQRGEELLEEGPLPQLFEPPIDPLRGHPGDPIVE
ncbi:MAG: DUF1823 family protein [Prochlorococcus sp.]|nr:DUF1823 family protein [Prochlorococcaceae cyanobacterium ETNP18_MAG_14]